MVKISFNNIIKFAEATKTYVEKNGALPSALTIGGAKCTYPQIGHILSKSINNLGKDINVIKVNKAPSPTNETVKINLKKSEYLPISKNYYKFIEDNLRLPNFSTIKGKKVSGTVVIYSFAKILVFYKNNKRLPNDCNFYTSETVKKKTSSQKSNCSNPYTSKPHYTSQGVGQLGQETSYFCGPNCVHQGLRKFGVTKYSQSKIASYAGTTTSGTDPDSLKSAIEKIARLEGMGLIVERKYLSDFGKTTVEQFKAIGKLMCQKNKFVFAHIGYQDSGEKASGRIFGHYETFDMIDVNKKRLRILNSLGSKCSSKGYCGHLQWRSFDLEKTYINNKTGVKSIWIITKQ